MATVDKGGQMEESAPPQVQAIKVVGLQLTSGNIGLLLSHFDVGLGAYTSSSITKTIGKKISFDTSSIDLPEFYQTDSELT